MKAESRFNCKQDVFYITTQLETLTEKCIECDNGKITTTKGSVLDCPICFGSGNVTKDVDIYNITTGKIVRVQVSFFAGKEEPNILYRVENTDMLSDYDSEILSEKDLFATIQEAKDYISHLESAGTKYERADC